MATERLMRSRIQVRALLHRVGGPNSVTWPGFLLSSALAVVVPSASIGQVALFADPRTLVPSLAGDVASYGLLAIARITFLRASRERSIPRRTVSAFALATLFGGVASSATAAGFGLHSTDSAPPSVGVVVVALVGSIATGTVMLSFSAVTVDAWREYRRLQADILALTYRLSSRAEAAESELEAQTLELRSELAALMLGRMEHAAWDNTAAASQELRRMIDEIVRPASRRLLSSVVTTEEFSKRQPPLDVGLLIADAIATPLLLPGAWAMLVCMPVFFTVTLASGLHVGLPSALLSGCGIAIVANVASHFQRSRPRDRVQTAATFLLAVVASTATVFGVLHEVAAAQLDVWAMLSVVALVPVIAALLTVAKMGSGVRTRQLAEVDRLHRELRWQKVRIGAFQWAMRNATARTLHGPVQSALLAAALRLEAPPAGSSGIAEVARMRHDVERVIDLLLQDPSFVVDLADTLARLRNMWASLCRIDVEAEPELMRRVQADPVCSSIASDVVTEACSDAIRHASARTIILRLTAGDRLLRVEARATGNAGAPLNEPGLGTMLLDRVSLDWYRTVDADGSNLVVELPLLPAL